jgi:hypothetical protein
MIFKKYIKINNYEILRFCNKLNYNIIGGASKLFKYFLNNFKYNEIISYSDRCYFNGNLYKILGFDFLDKTLPYYYTVDNNEYYKFDNFDEKILIEQKTDNNILIDKNILKIYNSGNLKFIYRNK